jgi:hypothetical protein
VCSDVYAYGLVGVAAGPSANITWRLEQHTLAGDPID